MISHWSGGAGALCVASVSLAEQPRMKSAIKQMLTTTQPNRPIAWRMPDNDRSRFSRKGASLAGAQRHVRVLGLGWAGGRAADRPC